ncbi:MAG: 3-dehydroquinate synthase [Deferrisomatales bacterium]|nr:3-dehydroquinate synthase [Deferrisomatales bacterium]
MRTVRVALGERTYEVAVGTGLLGNPAAAGDVAQPLRRRRIFLVSDRTVWPLHGAALEGGLAGLGARVLGRGHLEPGEAHKDLAAMATLWDAMVAAGLERSDLLVALGGGVVGDVAGFAAATYLRGIDFVQVPTTVLAMVDSSVGGKTGIDHPRGKNLLGAFHQPRGVLADLDTLRTLPRREVLSGLAEAVKAALLADPELFDLLEARGPGILEDTEALESVIARTVAIKARLVEADEREGGARALLNLGHTLGHAVEVAAGYGTFTHGEAVALGMGFAARLSRRLGLLSETDERRILGLLEKWGYPLRAPGVRAEKILDALRADKKTRGGVPRWVLPEAVGRARWGVTVAPEHIERLLQEAEGEQ